jgi:hypothetical protein
MNRRAKMNLMAALVMLAAAAGIFWNSWRSGKVGPQAFFYDLSKREIFTADAALIPPIRGIDGPEEDGVKAVVIAASAADKKNRTIAYLERYSPELKRDMEEARAKQTAPMISRGAAQGLRFVRRAADSNWYPMISAEGERIVTEWTKPGPDGFSPVVITP